MIGFLTLAVVVSLVYLAASAIGFVRWKLVGLRYGDPYRQFNWRVLLWAPWYWSYMEKNVWK